MYVQGVGGWGGSVQACVSAFGRVGVVGEGDESFRCCWARKRAAACARLPAAMAHAPLPCACQNRTTGHVDLVLTAYPGMPFPRGLLAPISGQLATSYIGAEALVQAREASSPQTNATATITCALQSPAPHPQFCKTPQLLPLVPRFLE